MPLFTSNTDFKISENIQKISTYIPQSYYYRLDDSIADKEEKITIKNMLEMGYFLVGQLNADGSYDKYVNAYIDDETGKIEEMEKREEGKENIKRSLRTRARNQENHDGAAFVFAKIPGTEVVDIMKRIKDRKKDILRIGDIIPWTDDTIVEIWERIIYEGKEALEVHVNHSSRWLYIDIETWERIVPEWKVDRMAAVFDDIAHNGISVVDGILAKIQERGH